MSDDIGFPGEHPKHENDTSSIEPAEAYQRREEERRINAVEREQFSRLHTRREEEERK